jgi:Cdc6-like AAA superfamily ATPase
LLGKLVTKELCECLRSLNESGYESYQDKHFRKRHEGTCSWMFSHKNYRSWLENEDNLILWIHGGPGFGKTVLSAVLSKELITDQRVSFGQECSVAYFFFDDKDDRLKSSYPLLTNILAQLLRQNPNALIHFFNEPVYNIDKEKTVWTVEMLWRVFRRIVNDEKLKPTIVIIDALGMFLSHRTRCQGCPVENSAEYRQMSARRKHGQPF